MNKKIVGIGIVIVIVAVVAFSASRVLKSGHNAAPPIGNSSTTTVVTSPSPSHLPLSIYYTINLPDVLLVTDTSGRRVGKDLATGAIYNEIPNSSYVEQQEGSLTISAPAAGTYTITVLGGQTGPYTLESYVFDGQHPPVPQVISGSIKMGAVVTYTQNYNPNNIGSSTVVP